MSVEVTSDPASVALAMQALPSDTDYSYETSIKRLVNAITLHGHVEHVHSLISHEDGNVRYAAFYCLCTRLRQNRDYTNLQNVMSANSAQFKTNPSYSHLELLAQVGLLGRFGNEEDFIRQSHQDATRFPFNAGFVHMFAGAVALVLEINEGSNDELATVWLAKAIDAAERAVRLDSDYAKFYATFGRLQSLNGDYKSASKSFDSAIDLEDSSRLDYAMRVNSYETYKMRNAVRKSGGLAQLQIKDTKDEAERVFRELNTRVLEQEEKYDRTIGSAIKRIDAASLKNLEFIGFFAAILSFTIGGIQISIQYPVKEAAQLIVILMGALLAAFSGFSLLIVEPKRRNFMNSIAVLTLGLAVIVGTSIWSEVSS